MSDSSRLFALVGDKGNASAAKRESVLTAMHVRVAQTERSRKAATSPSTTEDIQDLLGRNAFKLERPGS